MKSTIPANAGKRRSTGPRVGESTDVFAVEIYVPAAEDVEEIAAGAGAAAERLRSDLRYVGSIHVPDDELCTLLFEADTAGTVTDALGRAGVRFDHISRARVSEAAAAAGAAPAAAATRGPIEPRRAPAGPESARKEES